MSISFDKHLGIHQDALALRSQKAAVIASNLANIDTPGYKAMDFNFAQALQDARQDTQPGLNPNNPNMAQPMLEERPQTQPSANGNTVEIGQEQAAWAQNNTDWQTSFTFLNMQFKSLESAINGQ